MLWMIAYHATMRAALLVKARLARSRSPSDDSSAERLPTHRAARRRDRRRLRPRRRTPSHGSLERHGLRQTFPNLLVSPPTRFGRFYFRHVAPAATERRAAGFRLSPKEIPVIRAPSLQLHGGLNHDLFFLPSFTASCAVDVLGHLRGHLVRTREARARSMGIASVEFTRLWATGATIVTRRTRVPLHGCAERERDESDSRPAIVSVLVTSQTRRFRLRPASTFGRIRAGLSDSFALALSATMGAYPGSSCDKLWHPSPKVGVNSTLANPHAAGSRFARSAQGGHEGGQNVNSARCREGRKEEKRSWLSHRVVAGMGSNYGNSFGLETKSLPPDVQ